MVSSAAGKETNIIDAAFVIPSHPQLSKSFFDDTLFFS
jgi:hypothetical protein